MLPLDFQAIQAVLIAARIALVLSEGFSKIGVAAAIGAGAEKYVGVVRGALVNVQFKPNTYSVKLLPGAVGNDYRILLRPRRYNCEIARSLAIVPLNQYFEYMISKQLTTYAASNYGEFFDFVRQVKRLFDDNQLQDFFYASLKRVEPHDEQR